MPCMTPQTLINMIHSKSSHERSSTVAMTATPALLTTRFDLAELGDDLHVLGSALAEQACLSEDEGIADADTAAAITCYEMATAIESDPPIPRSVRGAPPASCPRVSRSLIALPTTSPRRWVYFR